jgi:drug/metabolite transporter (DMT)-like permease
VERIGIFLAIAVAICWGSADTTATFASRRLGTFTTTMISLLVSVVTLILFALLFSTRLSLSLAPPTLLASAPIGLLSGVMAAIGYFSLYRGLELGPVAIVSPIVAADGAFAAVLAIPLLHERVSLWQLGLLLCIFCGIFFASTDLAELRKSLGTAGSFSLLKGGPRRGLLAMAAFGIMLFSIGASAQSVGWFLPIFWTRCFAAFTLAAFGLWQRSRFARISSTSLSASVASADEGAIKPSLLSTGLVLAIGVGLFETTGLLVYSIATRLAATGIAAAISSSFGLIPLLVGLTFLSERPKAHQLVGVALVTIGLALLAMKPM